MDIIATIPLHKLEVARQEDEAVQGFPDEKCNWYWLLKPKPKNLGVGERIYFVEDGLITAWCPIMELGNFDFVCQVSRKYWTGYQARLGQNRLFLHPIAHRGFQGWRYLSTKLRARLDKLEVESSCEPLAPPVRKSPRRLATIAKLELTRVPTKSQVSLLEDVLRANTKRQERVIVSTTNRRKAENLSEYLREQEFVTKYFHMKIAPIERKRIAQEFRKRGGSIIGADTLEGLPQASTVIILDADQNCDVRTSDWLGYHAAHATKQIIVCADTLTPAICSVFPGLR